MKTKAPPSWQLLVERATRQVASFGRPGSFVVPDVMVFASGDRTCEIQAEQCELIDWTGVLPKGFTAQTCYLFRLEGDHLAEAVPAAGTDAVVL